MKRTLTAALLAVLLLTVLPTAGAVTTADAPWSGYRLDAAPSASAGWVGARKASGQVVYRIDPSRLRPTSAGFGDAVWQSTVTGVGPRTVTATDTARAAWIIGKYGDYRYALQNAAVEVALDHLLHGGRWALTGDATRQRLAQTPDGAAISRFATTMLNDSAKLAGPYAVTVAAPAARTGSTRTVTVRVTASRTGTGIANLPVTLTYAGTAVTGLRTGSDGTAKAQVPAGAAGPQTVTAVVSRLPEERVQLRTPTTPGASRIVVAGHKTSRTVTRTVAVQASPTLAVSSTSATVTTTQHPTGRVTVSAAYPGSRTATASLYGPFSTAAAATCAADRRAVSGAVAVTGSGTYDLPALTVPRYGYYVWGVSLPASTYNAAATACSGSVLARVLPGLAVAPSASRYRTGSAVHAQLTLAGLPAGYAATAGLRLYGPFFDPGWATCTGSYLKASQQVPVAQNGTVSGPDLRLTNLGYYVWVADLPASTFSLAGTTSCSAASAVFRVTW